MYHNHNVVFSANRTLLAKLNFDLNYLPFADFYAMEIGVIYGLLKELL